MEMDLNFGAPIPLGSFYNSVTDTVEKVPTGSLRTGNDPNPATTQLEDMWNDVTDETSKVAKRASDVIKSSVSSLADVAGTVGEKVEGKALKWILIVAGIGLLAIYVAGKSGAINLKAV